MSTEPKTHLFDATKPTMKVSACGLSWPSRKTEVLAETTCKHCRKMHKTRLARSPEYREAWEKLA